MPLEHLAITQAQQLYKLAEQNLRSEVSKKYPPGTIITCLLKGVSITLKVERPWWDSDPSMIYGYNIKTGKNRQVSATSESANIVTISTP